MDWIYNLQKYIYFCRSRIPQRGGPVCSSVPHPGLGRVRVHVHEARDCFDRATTLASAEQGCVRPRGALPGWPRQARRQRCAVAWLSRALYGWPMRIVASDLHPAAKVDPFGRLPCRHGSVAVHITDTESMGSDLVECRRCGYAMRLADLYQGLFPAVPGGTP